MTAANSLLAEINIQRGEIERQKKELTASLRYARNIQSAVLPSRDFIERILPAHFILFKPKDIVSGDFYWIFKKSNNLYIAAADCTGHGVPGALMSILGISFLNEIVARDENLTASGILNMLREKVMKALHQTGGFEEQKDGMDLALCIIDQETGELQFSGANNPVYIIRDKNITELKGDRMPIGVNAVEEKSFTNHTFQLEENDLLYLFTDGFADQFGGPFGKKIKYGPFREYIRQVSGESIYNQKEILIGVLENWKKNLEQVDDILIIGCKPYTKLKPV